MFMKNSSDSTTPVLSPENPENHTPSPATALRAEGKTVWIDLDNSPHVLFFQPIIQELKRRGVRVVVTTRDFAQVRGLADMFGLEYEEIGRHYGKNPFKKVWGMVVRAFQLKPVADREKPDLTLSHGSRSQLLISKLLGIPTVMATDYPQSKSGFPGATPDLLIVPEVVYESFDEERRRGVVAYRGIKENVYIQNLKPDPAILKELGVSPGNIVVTLRPPATAAHYYVARSGELYDLVMERILNTPGVQMVLLPRTKDQEAEVRERWKEALADGRMIIPKKAVNGLNLIWHSDLVLSGGGTIIREAAALRVPAYSLYAGSTAAVDTYLEDNGLLTFLRSEDDIQAKLNLAKRALPTEAQLENTPALQDVVDAVVQQVLKNQGL